MVDYEDLNAWLDKPFRKYIYALPEWPFPRPGILKDQFFDQKLVEILALSDEELRAQTKYIKGLGPVGEKALFRFIALLSADADL